MGGEEVSDISLFEFLGRGGVEKFLLKVSDSPMGDVVEILFRILLLMTSKWGGKGDVILND